MKPLPRLPLPLLLCSSLAIASPASADDPPQPPPPMPRMTRIVPVGARPALPGPPKARPAVGTVRPKTPPPPAGPPPDVKLEIDASTLSGPWVVRVRNTGSVPVMLAADGRMLSFDVTPRGERKAVHCELPADMRPSDDLDRSLVLPPAGVYAENVQPRLYCFGEHGLDALASGAIVVAHLGWQAGSRSETHQVVWPLDGVEPVVAAVPVLTSPPIALQDEPTATALATPVAQPALAEPVSLRVTGPRAVDAATFGTLSIAVTLHNDGSRPVRVRFRPEDLAFEIATSSGPEHCAWPVPPTAPMRELFSTLPPQGSESLSVLLSAYCRTKSFDQPGLVIVRPTLDTRRAGGEAIGLRTFNGQVIATTPTVVRLHQGTGKVRLVRPHLAPAGAGVDPQTHVDPLKP